VEAVEVTVSDVVEEEEATSLMLGRKLQRVIAASAQRLLEETAVQMLRPYIETHEFDGIVLVSSLKPNLNLNLSKIDSL